MERDLSEEFARHVPIIDGRAPEYWPATRANDRIVRTNERFQRHNLFPEADVAGGLTKVP
jgi:hypothetical protein